MQKLIYALLSFLAVVALATRAIGDDGGWTMPNLNPFSSNGHTPTSHGAGQPPTSGWKMPKLMPQTSTQPKRRANHPTTGSRAKNGTENIFSKTAAALNPWDKKQPAPPPKLTGSNSIFTNKSTTKPAKKDDSVKPASWWGSEKKSEPPKTVNDFLSKPRP